MDKVGIFDFGTYLKSKRKIRDSNIFPEDAPSKVAKQQSNLFIFDVEGLDETDIEKIKEQIERYKIDRHKNY